MRTPRWVTRTLARAKPVVPDRAWPALLAARSWVGSGPLIGRPQFRSVLLLAPHPDDEAIGAGGTLRLLADDGARITVAFATSGEATRGSSESPQVVAARRRQEAESAGLVLGTRSEFLGHPDGDLSGQIGALGAEMADLVNRLAPDVVFVPWFADGHADHGACTGGLAQAGLPSDLEVWGYETWTPLPANRLVDITETVAAKEAALAAHATAHLAFDIGATLGLSRYRSVHGLMGRGYAEAFLAAPLGRYLELAGQVGHPGQVGAAAPAAVGSGRAGPLGIPLFTICRSYARRPAGAP